MNPLNYVHLFFIIVIISIVACTRDVHNGDETADLTFIQAINENDFVVTRDGSAFFVCDAWGSQLTVNHPRQGCRLDAVFHFTAGTGVEDRIARVVRPTDRDFGKAYQEIMKTGRLEL